MKKFLPFFFCLITASLYAQEDSTLHTPIPGKAKIIFIRPMLIEGALNNWKLLENGNEFCIISNNRFVVKEYEPGTYTFSSVRAGIGIGKPKDFLEIDLEADKVYYVQCQVKTNLISIRILLNEITKRTATKFLEKAKPDNCNNKQESEKENLP